ncbi:MAG: hypothetical protein JW797_15910 [Bradymonadales bacterium]|nr:hypothetical protein [Bradymonadales bacterium]
MNCDRTRKHLVDYLYGELPPELAEEIERELDQCPHCAAEYRELRQVREMMGTIPRLEVPPQAHHNILREARLAAAQEKEQRERSPRLWWRVLQSPAFAAAFAIAILLVATTVLLRQNTEPLHTGGSDIARATQAAPTASEEKQELAWLQQPAAPAPVQAAPTAAPIVMEEPAVVAQLPSPSADEQLTIAGEPGPLQQMGTTPGGGLLLALGSQEESFEVSPEREPAAPEDEQASGPVTIQTEAPEAVVALIEPTSRAERPAEERTTARREARTGAADRPRGRRDRAEQERAQTTAAARSDERLRESEDSRASRTRHQDDRAGGAEVAQVTQSQQEEGSPSWERQVALEASPRPTESTSPARRPSRTSAEPPPPMESEEMDSYRAPVAAAQPFDQDSATRRGFEDGAEPREPEWVVANQPPAQEVAGLPMAEAAPTVVQPAEALAGRPEIVEDAEILGDLVVTRDYETLDGDQYRPDQPVELAQAPDSSGEAGSTDSATILDDAVSGSSGHPTPPAPSVRLGETTATAAIGADEQPPAATLDQVFQEGVSAYHRGEYTQTIQQLSYYLGNASPDAPYQQVANFYQGRANMAVGNYLDANENFQRVVAGPSAFVHYQEALYYLARSYELVGDLAQAEANYLILQNQVNPFQDEADLGLTRVRRASRSQSGAIEYHLDATEASPAEPAALER